MEIKDIRQIEALTSAVRQEIVDFIETSGVSSISEVAIETGRPADSLYYHIALCVDVGLLQVVGTRRVGRREETLYDVPGRPMRIRYDYNDSRGAAAVTRMISSMLRIADREFSAGIARPEAKTTGLYRNVYGGRRRAWLNADELKQVNRLLRSLDEIFTKRRPHKGRKPHAFSCILTLAKQGPSRRR